MTRVLVTGTGGPAGVAVVRSLLRRDDVEVFSADMDGWASGLYLVDADHRRIVPRGAAPEFVDTVLDMCRDDGVTVLVPTVDVELEGLVARRTEFAAHGIQIAAPSAETLASTLDKHALALACAGALRVPATELLDADGVAAPWDFPVIVKPRRGAGSRGVRLVDDRDELEDIGTGSDLIIQEHLPGAEYSVDVLAGTDGHVIAAVPRTRERVDSGVSIAGRTVRNAELVETAAAAARAVGLVGVANVQLRRDKDGRPALLEINPRFPGAMPLTIAAGVDMPSLYLDLLLGIPVPERVDFEEIANVRYLEDVFVSVDEIVTSTVTGRDEAWAEQ